MAGSLTGCSSSASSSHHDRGGRRCPRQPCHPRVVTPHAAPVSGVPTDWNITSFDGTIIRAHWFPLSTYVPGAGTGPHPTVLMGPGWSLSGDTDTTSQGILGEVPIRDLLDAGFNVLTWDPRGFGKSGGKAEVDSPLYEARDVSTLISWVAAQPGVELDAPGDPRMGMVGGSYGGGIQLVTAATDCRVDAIVPTIAWNSLGTSLDKSRTFKSGWSGLLTNLSSSDHVDPEVTAAYASGSTTGTITPSEASLVHRPRPGPTARTGSRCPRCSCKGQWTRSSPSRRRWTTIEVLRAGGVTTSMLWFCGGHGVCLTDPGDTAAPEQATLAWLKRYVQRDTSVSTGPGFEFVDQNGTTYTAPSYPLPETLPFTARARAPSTWSRPAGPGRSPPTRTARSSAAWWPRSPRHRPPMPSTSR